MRAGGGRRVPPAYGRWLVVRLRDRATSRSSFWGGSGVLPVQTSTVVALTCSLTSAGTSSMP